jgi:phage terminase large subunit-like protein
MKVLWEVEGARTWSFADTGPISRARQQPLFAKYLPIEIKQMMAGSGKTKKGGILNVSYGQKGGFTEETFVFSNRSQHWFKNYEQDIENVEGDQLDGVWFDELRNIELLKTMRGRMGDRGGVVIVTFTSIDENYSSIVNEYERGAKTILEVPAEMLPVKRPRNLSGGFSEPKRAQSKGELHINSNAETWNDSGDRGGTSTLPVEGKDGGINKIPAPPAQNNLRGNGAQGEPVTAHHMADETPAQNDFEIVGYENVPRIKVAGSGSDGNQRANIVYFHITDNPYYGYEEALKQWQRAKKLIAFGKDRFYKLYRGATRSKILSRVYGILQAGIAQQFPKFNDLWHCVDPDQVPKAGTNYLIVDPCPGRNWFMIWARIDPRGRWFVYREWPSTGHKGPSAYIPGIGDPGLWTLPGQPADGVRGPAQAPFGFGLDRYKREILRCEGRAEDKETRAEPEPKQTEQLFWRKQSVRERFGRAGSRTVINELATKETIAGEEISERWMDSRYGNSPTQTKEGSTTLINEMNDLGMDFMAASGKEIEEGTGLINDMLDYDTQVERGKYSATLARANEPKLFISRECPNVIYSLREWTGKDKQHGACKDPVDVLRYAALAELQYLGDAAYAWTGGGSY